jgi:hypothetical protein
VIDPETSAGTSYSVSVALPTTAFVGSMTMVYVPLRGNDFLSTHFPVVPKLEAVTRFVPSDLRIATVALDIVTPEILRLILRPEVPENVALAVSPEAVVVTVTGAPPATIV